MSTHYGFTITARRREKDEPGVFVPGHAFERGSFRLIIPMTHQSEADMDFVPVWLTEEETREVIGLFKSSPGGEKFAFQSVDIRRSIEAGGPTKRGTGLFRGVDGWTVPEPVQKRFHVPRQGPMPAEWETCRERWTADGWVPVE